MAACASVTPPPPQTPPVASAAPPAAEEPRPVPPHPPHKPELASLPAAKSPPPETPGEDGFVRLQGLDQEETVAVLGEPQQRAESPPAVLWRYASRDCELDVYFYLDLQSREMRILHYEVRNNDGNERSHQQCYGELVTARRAEPTGSADPPR